MTGFTTFKHPEIKDDEFMLSNIAIGEEWLFGFFNKKTPADGRLGKIAYDTTGYISSGHIPVFKKKKPYRGCPRNNTYTF